MNNSEKCGICGRWEESIYTSTAKLNFLRWMKGSKTYILCSDCAKQLESIFDGKTNKFDRGDEF